MGLLQLGEIEAIHHGTYRYKMWWWNNRGYTPAGVEAWNYRVLLPVARYAKPTAMPRMPPGVTPPPAEVPAYDDVMAAFRAEDVAAMLSGDNSLPTLR